MGLNLSVSRHLLVRKEKCYHSKVLKGHFLQVCFNTILTWPYLHWNSWWTDLIVPLVCTGEIRSSCCLSKAHMQQLQQSFLVSIFQNYGISTIKLSKFIVQNMRNLKKKIWTYAKMSNVLYFTNPFIFCMSLAGLSWWGCAGSITPRCVRPS